MRFFKAIEALALISAAVAQNATYCSGKVCYAVNVPASTAWSGTGDIYFQISGPSSLSWIGLGQGSSMQGASIFIIYADSAGTNVTLSPRLGTGNREPDYNTAANVTLLAGSGIINDVMTANVRCSNCNSWSNGSMSLTDSDSKWIWAYQSGDPVSSDSVNVNVHKHNAMGTATLNLQNAVGGNSTNPFATTFAATISSSSTSPSGNGSDSSSSDVSPDEPFPSNYSSVQMAHGIMGPIAFVLFFPFGAIFISFPGLVWFHAGWMFFTYTIVLASMGMGVWMAVVTQQLDTVHAIFGLVVVGCLLLQPITGLTHHLLYKRVGRPNATTYPHVWWGRAITTLGIVNGGLGLWLSGNTIKGEIAYGAVAGSMWLLWMTVIALAYFKTKKNSKGETGDYVFGREKHNESDGSMSTSQSLQLRSTA